MQWYSVAAHLTLSPAPRGRKSISSSMKSGGIAGEMEVEAYRRLFPLPFYERHLLQSVRPDARPLDCARDTTIALGPVTSADGSALVKIGDTTMLAAIKLEVMTPSVDSPDEGCFAIDLHMPPICSPTVRPGRPAEIAPVISKQLADVIMRFIQRRQTPGNDGVIDRPF